jgi:hypothetical protein
MREEIAERKNIANAILQNNNIQAPRMWMRHLGIKKSSYRENIIDFYEKYKVHNPKSRNFILPQKTYDGPGITIQSMEKEKDMRNQKLREEKYKVI